ncbi:N-acetylmuramoyl-L-alanine amidase [Aliarcobacter cibarius]|uniref:N-acetylmuramoyl-L-alanine amidase n=3 Tax=Aliarcobacter cibarius TaxID=255507 RepID=A0A7L5JQT6_9BACT|nr:N-acetylmuramoyl-L-alanine amidase [Aliarcobacter cibarius]TLS96447.1 N-acetylmuramoyl-L-alanine amidase [Aliarcobacter cibarius]TLS96873.1 N-acetylmuramoyl-L-alanine amidase [Aliarcobacter cibarius]TLT03958.1 N-acetylmuramoyl-L-alanine amidase [Aliarcobacter cibarius]
MLILFIFLNLCFATSLEEQYRDAKIEFLKSSLKKDDNQKVSDLKKVIDLGKKLNKDTTPDEAKLKILESRQEKSQKYIEKNELKIKKAEVINKKEPYIENNKDISSNQSIDTQNLIKQITQIENKIVVKFNKNIDKSYLTHKGIKRDGIYEYTFEINGKYKYTNPTKISIENIDKVSALDLNNKTIIRIENAFKPKISFMIKPDELIIMAESDNPSSKQEVAKNQNTIEKKNSKKEEQKVQNNLEKNEQKSNPKEKSVIEDEVIFSDNNNKSNPKNRIIVIDAGHGGDDVGAVGPNKRYEKVVNLEVTKYLYKILKQRGYNVYLTRSNDKFIKVMDRTILANDKNADLFISIHTNAMPKEKANSTSGIETFFLSPARSERAKRVAALENKDDIREMNESSKSAFLESLNRPRITASHKFAIDVQAGLLQSTRTKYKDVKDTGVKEGPFWVLVGAQMPSILIELGFISHPEESRRLYEKSYQQLLANGIANGIDSYFSKNP